jgi:hypothetical protein
MSFMTQLLPIRYGEWAMKGGSNNEVAFTAIGVVMALITV